MGPAGDAGSLLTSVEPPIGMGRTALSERLHDGRYADQPVAATQTDKTILDEDAEELAHRQPTGTKNRRPAICGFSS